MVARLLAKLIPVSFVVDRLKERSTYVGLFTFLAAQGVTFHPEAERLFIQIGMAVVGLVLMVTKDHLPVVIQVESKDDTRH